MCSLLYCLFYKACKKTLILPPGIDLLYIKGVERHCAQIFDKKIYLYGSQVAKVMKKELNYWASKKWEKVGRQELRSTPYKQEIDP
jgi:hypothetical protein